MTRYLKIGALGPMRPMGLDDKDRKVIAFNVLAVKQPSETVEEEMVKVLVDADVGTYGVDLWAGENVVIPEGEGPYMVLVLTGGAPAIRTQNLPATRAYDQLSAQFSVRARDPLVARAKAFAAYAALDAVRNVDIVP